VAKRIAWTEQAKVDLRGIDRETALQILRTLARYAANGAGDVKQLHGIDPPLYRLRAQDHRIFFRDKPDYLEISRARSEGRISLK
jgi:mRNA-degrading endonuclease RelE of RelBE toxin-antitoxin system